MKRAIGRCIGVAAVMLLVITAGVTVPYSTAPHNMTAIPQETQPYRIIRVWEGQVAVFVPSETTPESVYDTMVRSLPDEEQQKLAVGIEVTDENGLRRMLEDYLS